MKTPASPQNRLICLRLLQHLQDLQCLLAEVRRCGGVAEEVQVREAIACTLEWQALPPKVGSFHALAVMQQRCLRDLSLIRQAARPAPRHAAPARSISATALFRRFFQHPAVAA
jgi:hypothetical protein